MASALLQLAPIILVVIYILEYTYVFQFLSQFGVTPEEVGISEIKLLTRAATYTLATVSIVGLAVAIAGGIIAVQASIEESNWIQGMLKKLKRARRPQNRNQNSMTKSIETASKQAESIRDVCTASFAAILTVIIVGLKPLGIQLSILAIIALAVAWLALIATLFVGWRNKSTRSLTLACGTAIGIFLLGLAVVNGGLNKGKRHSENRQYPNIH